MRALVLYFTIVNGRGTSQLLDAVKLPVIYYSVDVFPKFGVHMHCL